MLRTLLPALLLLVFSLPAASPAAGLPDDLKEYLDSLSGDTLYLRKSFNSSRKVYCESAGAQCYFIYQQGRLFPLKYIEAVTVGDSRYFPAENRLRLRLEHRSLGRQTISFHWPRGAAPSLAGFRRMLGLACAATGQDNDYRPFIGNRSSRKLHFVGCNHLPPDSLQRESFASEEQARKQGYEQCELCFTSFPNIRDYFLEASLGRQTASAARSLYPLNTNPGLKKRLSETGKRVLESWPSTLRGYRYTFEALNSGRPNAFACPGGRIFVTTGLYYALETETELEGVLAHEITHVERRHGLRSYQKVQTTGFWASLLAPAADLAVWYSTRDRILEKLSVEAAGNIARLAARLVLTGYGIRQEMESDFYAISYLRSIRGDSTSYAQALRKMQYSGNLAGATGEYAGDLPLERLEEHPEVDLRIEIAQNAKIELYRPAVIFTGYDSEGEQVAEVRFESQAVSRGLVRGRPPKTGLTDYGTAGKGEPDRIVNRLYLYATVSSTPALGKICELKEIRLRTPAGALGFDNEEDTALLPDDETACTFQVDRAELLGEIEEIELKLNNVRRWRRELPLE